MALHALLGVAAIWVALLGLAGWWGLAIVPLAALSALLWRSDWQAMAVLILAGVVFLPIGAVALLGQFLLYGLELGGWALGRRQGPQPKAGPLGRTRRAKVRARRRVRDAVEEHERSEHQRETR
jgi:hypothetical protein